MLAPQPGRTSNAPKPVKLLAKPALLAAWKSSRDATSRPGRPGINNVTARQFAAKLDTNLDEIVRRLRRGDYGFSKLRVAFVPKPESDKERVICIPTVQDRLVQRAIVRHLVSKDVLPIKNASSFGFIKDLGPPDAIKKALEFRAQYKWCLKTDIQSFFDRIPRPYLKSKVAQSLGGSSLESLVLSAIDCEVKATAEIRSKLQQQGIKPCLGIRQGMPLSPLLANLALADFDQHVEGRHVRMVRYADDLVLFFRSEDEARDGQKYIKLLLSTFQLSIPEIADGSKTRIVPQDEPLEFLGREIARDHNGKFIVRVGDKQIEKIVAKLAREFSFEYRSSRDKNFQDTVVDLSKSLTAYLGIYRDADNFIAFQRKLRDAGSSVIIAVFQDLFGEHSLRSLQPKARKFLGIEILDALEPNPELDV